MWQYLKSDPWLIVFIVIIFVLLIPVIYANVKEYVVKIENCDLDAEREILEE